MYQPKIDQSKEMESMKSVRFISYSTCFVALLCGFQKANAQDSTRRKTIDITSTFKPVLRDAVKLNFSAALPKTDTIRPVLSYNIPVQEVKLAFQPGSLNPVALQADSLLAWKNSQYLKVGVGNNHLPYLQGAVSLGNSNTGTLSAYGELFSAKGKLPFQKHNLADFQLRGSYKIAVDHELSAKAAFRGEDFFLYGYQPETLSFSKADLRQRFQTVEGVIGLRNTDPSAFGLIYSPSLKIVSFRHQNADSSAREENLVFNLPLQKTFGKSFGFNLGFTADMTRLKPEDKSVIKNNLYYLSPALTLKTPNVFIQAGILPSWDNKVFNMLPNIMAEITTNDQQFTFQAGWIGYYNKGSFQRFSTVNPWLAQPTQLLNHRVAEIYGGFKGTLATHFTYSAKAAFSKQHNVNLFVNDQQDGKTFQTVYSPSMDVLQLHGEIGYLKGENFNFKTGITYSNFTRIEGQAKAWGLFPLELNASLRVKVIDDLYLKADFFGWDGPAYRSKSGEDRKGDKAVDLNAGLEFKVLPKFDLWLQMNNIFNNKYERWNQYQNFGFNVLGGVIYRFNQK